MVLSGSLAMRFKVLSERCEVEVPEAFVPHREALLVFAGTCVMIEILSQG